MKESVIKYGGFYIGCYETVKGKNNVPQSKKSGRAGDIWVHIPPQDMIKVCKNLYPQNKSVTVFLSWGITWNRTLQWLVETGCKTVREVESDSSSWGNYSNNPFGSRDYSGSGVYKETKAHNIYDLAGNFWEWTQERTTWGYAAVAEVTALWAALVQARACRQLLEAAYPETTITRTSVLELQCI